MSPLDISSSPNQRWLAKEFASSLDQTHRSTRHDVHGYVEFAKHLGETEAPEPDPDFCAALRHRLLHELIEDDLLPQDELALRREQQAPRRKGGSHCFERAPREPWIAAASTVLVVCGGAIGIGQESSQALPTDSLYPVKRFFESGEMAIAGSSSTDQARELMEQATERLDEARQLVVMDEVHAQEALPATIADFSEAASDAGTLVIEESQVASSVPDSDTATTLASEFRTFSTAAHVVLDELAEDADPQTATLIADAQSTLDGIDQQLPLLDPVLDVAEDLPEALGMLGLGGGQHEGTDDFTSIDEPTVASVPVVGDLDPAGTGGDVADTVAEVTEPLDEVTEPLGDATSALESSVSVVEVATSDAVSVAVATVNTTVKTVDETVRKTVETAKQTIDQTVRAVDETVRTAVDTAKQTVDQTMQAVDETVQQASETLQQTTDALQQTTDNLQSVLGSAPEAPAQSEAPDADDGQALGDLVQDQVGGLQQTTDSLLSSQLTS